MIVNDKMQQNYAYDCVEPMGENFDPLFAPELTPKEMLNLGVFEGHYLTDCRAEFPADWFVEAKLSDRPDENCNYFKVKSRQSLQVWQQKGWIIGPDVRGWFQWYCRYYMGVGYQKLIKFKLNAGVLFADIKPKFLKIVLLWI